MFQRGPKGVLGVEEGPEGLKGGNLLLLLEDQEEDHPICKNSSEMQLKLPKGRKKKN